MLLTLIISFRKPFQTLFLLALSCSERLVDPPWSPWSPGFTNTFHTLLKSLLSRDWELLKAGMCEIHIESLVPSIRPPHSRGLKKLFNLFFNWRVIALQNFVIFCQTSTWISHRYTYVPSLKSLPPTSHPSRLLQSPGLSSLSHAAKSCWLSISHMVMWVSLLLSPYIPPSPSSALPPTLHVPKSMLYVCHTHIF